MADYTRDSSFNMGIAHLTRIDAILYDIASASSEEDYITWHNTLNVLSREVSFLFNKDETELSIKADNTCANSINEYLRDKTFENKSKAYNALVDYELFIKKQLSQRKMLMAFSKDLRSSITDLG
jgi:hypothetical protein